MSKNIETAFPYTWENKGKEEVDIDGMKIPSGHGYTSTGMTLRDYFAAKAMQALISDFSLHATASKELELALGKYVAKVSYEFADAMLAERNKEYGDGKN